MQCNLLFLILLLAPKNDDDGDEKEGREKNASNRKREKRDNNNGNNKTPVHSFCTAPAQQQSSELSLSFFHFGLYPPHADQIEKKKKRVASAKILDTRQAIMP